MLQHKINLIIWIGISIEGVKYKKYKYNNKQMRLIEYTKKCRHTVRTGHYGLILEGEMGNWIPWWKNNI